MPLKVEEYKALAPFTIYKIGGPARFFIEARGEGELKEGLRFAKEKKLSFFILGAGSNILVSDKGYDGVVIRVGGGELTVDGDRLTVDAGVMMARVSTAAATYGLSGFEWAIGIPGTIGGSVRGNAGCFGGEMKDVVESVRVLEFRIQNSEFRIFELANPGCEFGYRDSIFKHHADWIILSATLSLQKGDMTAIQERIRAISRERAEKQDIGTKSAGCIFKNISWEEAGGNRDSLVARFPELAQFKDRSHISASFLLDRAGMKGERAGRIYVSSAHANFFVNEGGGTAEEVKKLIDAAKDKVRTKYGLQIEEEIQYLGFYFCYMAQRPLRP